MCLQPMAGDKSNVKSRSRIPAGMPDISRRLRPKADTAGKRREKRRSTPTGSQRMVPATGYRSDAPANLALHQSRETPVPFCDPSRVVLVFGRDLFRGCRPSASTPG
jgi:hypothetical protein